MSQPIRLFYVEFVFEFIVHAQRTSLLEPEHLQLLPPQNPAGLWGAIVWSGGKVADLSLLVFISGLRFYLMILVEKSNSYFSHRQ